MKNIFIGLSILTSFFAFAEQELGPVPCKITRGCKTCSFNFYIKAADGNNLTLPKVTKKTDPLYLHTSLASMDEDAIIKTFDVLKQNNICTGDPSIPAPQYNTGVSRQCYLQECLAVQCMYNWYVKTTDGPLEDTSSSLPRISSLTADTLEEAKNKIRNLQNLGFCNEGAIEVRPDTTTP